MSVQVSATATTRRSANFQPSIWGNHFLSYDNDNNFMETSDRMEHETLKEQVRKMLMESTDTLEIIDAIQRLGVSYHFETETDEILLREANTLSNGSHLDDKAELHDISLKFRLLRQQGYSMSCDVFNKFKDNKGRFKDSLVNDARGMLSLYEATHLRVHGEDILDEALAFTSAHLHSMATQLNSPLSDQINHALKQPIHTGLPRLEARNYLSIYQASFSCNEVLLSFAKLDFNLLQEQHQKELCDITKWWKELDFANKLPFARDRVVECYFWILGVYFEPQFTQARRILTKVIALTTIIDDIYDVFGTPEELELFTDAIQRWDPSAEENLPDYMKEFYMALLDVYSEIEDDMLNQGTLYRFHYAREAMKNQVEAYFVESKWFHQKYVPTMEEYMAVALATSGYELLAITSLVGMGDIVTKDSFDWLSNKPNKILIASQTISRLMDDIVSHKFEQKRGHVASSIECYMKQYGATEEEAVGEFRRKIEYAWKDINEECLNPTSVAKAVLTRILNLARVMDVVYKDGDGFTHAGLELKHFVSSLLVDPVPL
ncbi:(-)-germacrene D synthase-like [Mercurialis annua]|uniref:(-)-germacrene D synthase-like n=1 Tax=Mercurialis annua TaxID=3986 RepID=UPI002160B404|nr:(-)-germacrene D synthase-like [Mercurialis annua]